MVFEPEGPFDKGQPMISDRVKGVFIINSINDTDHIGLAKFQFKLGIALFYG